MAGCGQPSRKCASGTDKTLCTAIRYVVPHGLSQLSVCCCTFLSFEISLNKPTRKQRFSHTTRAHHDSRLYIYIATADAWSKIWTIQSRKTAIIYMYTYLREHGTYINYNNIITFLRIPCNQRVQVDIDVYIRYVCIGDVRMRAVPARNQKFCSNGFNSAFPTTRGARRRDPTRMPKSRTAAVVM